ncbi:MAG: protein GlxC [Rhodobacteraceae bacterium]|nr:protein GlxC [Paracoccaceae bacterium]
MSALRENVRVLDLLEMSRRKVNVALQSHNGSSEPAHLRILNPAGAHALACGLDAPVSVDIEGHTGYFCAGMNKLAQITVFGNAGQGVAENMMSGRVHVRGDVSQSAAATAHGGLLVVEGNAAARCGISLKGGNIVVKGNVGHMSMFMAQAGCLVVLGDADEALGDSIYEAAIYVRGSVASLGADCVEKDMADSHREQLRGLLREASCGDIKLDGFRRYGSARELYHFKQQNIGVY